ncbi:MAG TPA: hypothetical protein VOA19_11235, partial [Actinomycetes bacterium]|nr:hypothetical protein [Actinomycetes bacterium]
MAADIAKLSVGREEYYTRELATDHQAYLSGHGESQAAGTAPAPPAWGCRAKHPWPGGVFVIDSKQYRGRLQLDPSGQLWHGRYPLTPMLRAVSFEADQAAQVLPDPGMAVAPIVAVHGAQVPWGKVVVDGVPVVPARRLPSMLCQLPAVLGPERVVDLADQV